MFLLELLPCLQWRDGFLKDFLSLFPNSTYRDDATSDLDGYQVGLLSFSLIQSHVFVYNILVVVSAAGEDCKGYGIHSSLSTCSVGRGLWLFVFALFL